MSRLDMLNQIRALCPEAIAPPMGTLRPIAPPVPGVCDCPCSRGLSDVHLNHCAWWLAGEAAQ